MSHAHNSIITCDHVTPGKGPEVLWIEAGQVQAAVCLKCAHEMNIADATGGEAPAAMRPICLACAPLENIPVAAKMPDGFYELEAGQWVKQPEAGEVQ